MSPGGFFGRLAASTLKLGGWVLAAAALFAALAFAYSHDQPVSTSREALVSDDEPYQARAVAFHRELRRPDSIVLVLSGGTTVERRRAVDRLCAAYRAEPAVGAVVCGLTLEEVGPLAPLWEPSLLERDMSSVAAYAGGVASAIEMGLDGEASAASSLEDLGRAVAFLDTQLHDPPRPLPPPKEAKGAIDEEGYLSTEDGAHHLIVLSPALESMEGEALAPLVSRVRAIRDATPLGSVSAAVTGTPAMAVDELASVRRGLLHSSLAATAAVLVILLFTLRSWVRTLVSVAPLFLAVGTSLALAKLLFGGLNLITSSFISVLLGLGIDFAIYVLVHEAQLRSGDQHAMGKAIAAAGPGVVVGGVTTMLAFATITTTKFTAYAELGVIVAVGLAVAMVATLVVLPPLVARTSRWQPPFSDRPPPGSAWLVRFALPVVAVGFTVLLGAASGLGRVRFNPRYFDFLPDAAESTAALEALERDRHLSPILAATAVGDLEEAQRITERLRALDVVASVESPTDLLPPLTPERLVGLRRAYDEVASSRTGDGLGRLDDAVDELAYALRQTNRDARPVDRARADLTALTRRLASSPDGGAKLVAGLDRRLARVAEEGRAKARSVAERGRYASEDLPPSVRERFASPTSERIALFVRPAVDVWDRAEAARFHAAIADLEPFGPAIDADVHTGWILNGFRRASLVAVAFVVVVVFVGLRRIADTLLALLPLAFGLGATLGIMGWLDLRLDVANIVVVPLLLGIGVDAGAHVMARCQQAARQHGGVAPLGELLGTTGVALVGASLTTIAGFAALMVGDYGAMKSLGATMTIGVAACLFASGIVLPALLVVLRRAG